MARYVVRNLAPGWFSVHDTGPILRGRAVGPAMADRASADAYRAKLEALGDVTRLDAWNLADELCSAAD